jgi:hypothetical protein
MSGDSVKVSYPVDALVSYHYYAEDKTMAPLVATGRLRLIGDSGAFSALTQGAAIKLDAYADWVRRWREHLLWAASLDVIGDAAGTWRNWTTLRDTHDLATVPTLHAGADVRWLDRYAAEGVDFLGLGGMAGTGQAGRAFRWAVKVFRYARDHHPDMRFHLWGVTNRQFLDNLPCWSADSSGILGAAYRYAQLRLFDPATGRHHNVALRGDRAIYRLSALLRKVYGVDPGEIERSHPGNRTTLIRLAAASTQQYANWLQARHQVSAPASLATALAGPRVHVVANNRNAPGNSNLELAVADDPVGPRVHVVADGYGTDLPALAGPRLHLTDAAVDKLAAVAGPRVHVVGNRHMRQAIATWM